MIFVASNLIGEYLKAREKYKLDDVMNIKKYTVSDTPLSYRQTNSLDSDNLLDTGRISKSSWRKFSYKELVYFEIIIALKEFGIKQGQLKPLWEAFFKEPPTDKKQIELVTKEDAEMAIFCVFGGIEMTLVVYSEGNVLFSDPLHLARLATTKSQIRISLNEIVNKLNPVIGLDSIPVQYTLQNAIFDNFSIITPKEKNLLKIIRDRDYSVIKIKKKNGEIAIAYAERNKDIEEISPKDLEKLLETKDYMDISIVKRDGKIMNYKLEETIKL